ILMDRGKEFACDRPDCSAGCECDRYLEIWNLVFMQFNRDASGKMIPLPKPSIDTGMGLERIVSIIQDVPTNYETDLIIPIINKTESLSEKRLGDSSEDDIAMKVIADHSRAAAFLIGDGIMPSNEGRGYVLRRIIRRAIRYGRHIGLTKPFLHKTTNVVFDIMKPVYPELRSNASFITNVIKNEEVRFSETLDKGLKLLNETLLEMRDKGQREIPGQLIFKLYDTYGFPLDIVKDVIRDKKDISLDIQGFNNAMEGQRNRSRSITVFSELSDAYKKLSSEEIKPEFVGYDKVSCNAKVLVIVDDGNEIQEASSGRKIEVVTDFTPFYAESGGQVGDTGKITGPDFVMEVSDTIKDPTGLIIHKGIIISGTIKKENNVILTVDVNKRDAIACNHTVTHILHSALRQILGDHVKQAGSLVAPDRLRFDFTHFSQVDTNTLDKIETLVNTRIRRNVSVQIEEMDAENALKSGATALFEEKYGEKVRVVSLSDFSKELCGGIHTKYTGNIGHFKITGESSVASGVRRIEALTGEAALIYTQKTSNILRNTARLIKEKPEALTQKVEKILADYKFLEKEIERLKAQIASRSVNEIKDDIKSINGIKVLAKKVSVDNSAALRDLADKFKEKIRSGIVVLGCNTGPKVLLITIVTKDLADRFHAGNIVKQIAVIVGGGGGGRPDMAQAGGTKPEMLDKALDNVFEIVENT
ncbi:MAG: alanine--tRNA ligase, partial [Desulfobacterales bacterium]|nr:alanine--tRNA ligase [Desulfobacterales bacterium]